MRIAIGQINTTVGDIHGNADLVRKAYHQAVAGGADLVVFPEMALCGYPPRDLLLKSRFVPETEDAMSHLAREVGKVPAVVGFVRRNPHERGRHLQNSAAWCADGAIQAVAVKSLLPSYDVFDEDRYFEPAERPTVVDWRIGRVALTICEDIWGGPECEDNRRYHRDPIPWIADRHPNLLLNLSASPWHLGKRELRRRILSRVAQTCRCPVVYANAVGGNDELIFDGGSMVVGADGSLLSEAVSFAQSCHFASVNGSSIAPPEAEPLSHLHAALVLGLRDYAHKCGFRRALVGLSGGIDSALTAVLAAEALGPSNVTGVSLPSAISSQHSLDDARALAENLGLRYEVIPIASTVEAAEASLGPAFAGQGRDVTEENIQARVRGLLLMALSNKFNALLLTTGNKSELAVGYCTLYGDMCGGLAVLSDLPKTRVYDLARWVNRSSSVIPDSSITKAPSAELRPGQTDQDSLPPYEILDEILRLYVEEGRSRAEIAQQGFAREVVEDVVRKVDRNEYKRKQAAPGLKISPLAFGIGRRIPIVQRYVG